MRHAAITGMGAVSCYGQGCDALRDGLASGRDGIGPVRRFDLTAYATDLAAMVPAGNVPDLEPYALCVDFAVDAIREAVGQAGLEPGAMDSPRSALFLGLSPIDGGTLVHELATDIRDRLGWRCAVLTFSTACCSSTAAIGNAGAWLDAGRFDRIVAGGAEAIVPGLYAGFYSLGALTMDRCSPFSQTLGTTLGEGAGFVVLEREAANPRAWIQGFGLSNDAWHETSPDPSGAGIALSLQAALSDAGTDEVDYVNAHGTGTAANDIAETMALRTVLGDPLPPVSSTKGHLGHTQAAAGALELIATLVCEGTLPPTLRATPKRARMPEDCVASLKPRPGRWTRFAKNSAAFGGANGSLVIARESGLPSTDRQVWIAGIGAIGRQGSSVEALVEAWATGERGPIEPDIPPVRRVDTGGMDPSGRLATAATAAALKDAGIRTGRGSTDGIGVVGGMVCASPTEKDKLDAGIEERGLINLPVSSFAKLGMNAPASAAARGLGLRGPHTAVSTGTGSGLASVVTSAALLARDATAEALVAVGVHEPPAAEESRGYGASAVVLTSHATPIRLAAWSLAATLEAATTDALARAGLTEVDLRFGPETDEHLGLAPGLAGVNHLVLAVHALRTGTARHALVTGAGTACMAVVVVREDG